jgi:hypothetical protein
MVCCASMTTGGNWARTLRTLHRNATVEKQNNLAPVQKGDSLGLGASWRLFLS